MIIGVVWLEGANALGHNLNVPEANTLVEALEIVDGAKWLHIEDGTIISTKAVIRLFPNAFPVQQPQVAPTAQQVPAQISGEAKAELLIGLPEMPEEEAAKPSEEPSPDWAKRKKIRK